MTLGSDWVLGLEQKGHPWMRTTPVLAHPDQCEHTGSPSGTGSPWGTPWRPLLGHLGAQSRQVRVSCFLFRK